MQIKKMIAWIKPRLNSVISNNSRIVIILFNLCYFSVILLISDLSWPLFGDAHFYADMAQGIAVEAPFSYRIIIPWIVSLFPILLHQWVFLGITIGSLTITSVLLFDYIRLKGLSLSFSYLGVVIFMGSNVCEYHLLNFGLVDPVFLCLVISSLYLLERKKSIWVLPLLIVGFFVKESLLFVVPIVVVDAIINRDRVPAILATLIGAALSLITLLRPTGYTIAYIIENIEYNGINMSASIPIIIMQFVETIVLQALWVYGIILFSAIVGFVFISRKDKLNLIILLGSSAIMALFATDWARMLFFPFPLIILMGLLPFNQKEDPIRIYWLIEITIIASAVALFILGPAAWLLGLDNVLVWYLLLSALLGVSAIVCNFSSLKQLIRWRHSSSPLVEESKN